MRSSATVARPNKVTHPCVSMDLPSLQLGRANIRGDKLSEPPQLLADVSQGYPVYLGLHVCGCVLASLPLGRCRSRDPCRAKRRGARGEGGKEMKKNKLGNRQKSKREREREKHDTGLLIHDDSSPSPCLEPHHTSPSLLDSRAGACPVTSRSCSSKRRLPRIQPRPGRPTRARPSRRPSTACA